MGAAGRPLLPARFRAGDDEGIGAGTAGWQEQFGPHQAEQVTGARRALGLQLGTANAQEWCPVPGRSRELPEFSAEAL